MSGTGSPPDRGGFALALVVFLLFAIGLAGTLGYEAVRTEAALSLTNQQGSQAFTAAQAGLQRFMAEAGDTVVEGESYTVLEGDAAVTARRTFDGPYPNRRYLLEAVGTYLDPRFSENAVERTLYLMAEHERVPVDLLGALVSPSEDITVDEVEIDGRDAASVGTCPEAGQTNLAGVVGGGSVNGAGGGGIIGALTGLLGAGGSDLQGSPKAESYPGPEAVMDSLGVDWDVLIDPAFPVEHDDEWPVMATLPADSFPTIRWNSNFNANAGRTGRGLLIVNGRIQFGNNFEWDGLILADQMAVQTSNRDFEIRGGLIVGLDASGDAFTIEDGGEIVFHSCNVIEAGRGLAHLAPLAGTWWEAF